MVRYSAFRRPYVPGVVLGSWFIAGLLCCCATVQAQIFRYQGPDGRLYFTNVPLTPVATPPVVTRPALSTTRPALSTTQLTLSTTQPTLSTRRLVAQEPVLPLLHRLAQQYSVDPRLVHAIITVESNFDPRAVSRAGAQGLMQLMPDTAARYRVVNPFDPQANLEGGMRYLRDLLLMFPGDLRHVLAAYNAGEGAVQQYGGIPPYPETQRYVERVLALYGASTPTPEGKFYRYRTASGSILLTDTLR
jgi:hypothetical protein